MSTKKQQKPLLLEAHEIITGERQEAYGDAFTTLTMIGQQWSLYLSQRFSIDAEIDITADDVCWMMADLKKSRQISNHSRENILDAAGYIGLIDQVTP